MLSRSFISSAVLHGIVLALMAMDFSLARFDMKPTPASLIMVDLTKVQISDKTNLPPKKQAKPASKKQTVMPSKPKSATVRSTKVQPVPSAPPKPKPQPPVKNAAPVVEPKPTNKPISKNKPMPQPKSAEPTRKPGRSKPDLNSLLASVDKIKRAAPAPKPADTNTPAITEGIEGGTGGSLSQIVSVSDRDLIANQLRKNWNVDAGKEGIEDLVIEVKVLVNKDGSVRSVKILSKVRNGVERSVAESAERAIWICDKKTEESPFKMLAERYADHYGDWKEIHLRFSPLAGIF